MYRTCSVSTFLDFSVECRIHAKAFRNTRLFSAAISRKLPKNEFSFCCTAATPFSTLSGLGYSDG